jgi:hypothetical protein
MDLQQLVAMLSGRRETPQASIGDFAGEDWHRTPAADINRMALYQGRSALRQQFDPLQAPPPVPQGLQAPAQPMQMPRGQGMFGRMGIQQAAAAAPTQAPVMAPDQADWRQAADTEASRTFRPLPMGEEAPRRGLEPPSARDVLTDEYLQQRGPNYRFEGGYTGPRPGTPDQRGDRDNWQPVPQPPQSAYRRADPPAPTIEDGAWTAALERVRARLKTNDPTGLREAADRELAPLRNRVRADQNRQRIAEDLTARYRSSR